MLAGRRHTDLRHSSMREAMPWRLIMLTTQMRLIPQIAGSGVVEQHQALCRSNITFSPSEPSGTGSSITRYPCDQSQTHTRTRLSIKPKLMSKSINFRSFFWHHTWYRQVSHLLYVLRYQASSHFLVIGDKEEGFGLRGTLGLHLLEAEVIVHHLSDLLNLWNKQAAV